MKMDRRKLMKGAAATAAAAIVPGTMAIGGPEDPMTGMADSEIVARAFAEIVPGERILDVVENRFEYSFYRARWNMPGGLIATRMTFLTPSLIAGHLHQVGFEFRPDRAAGFCDTPEIAWLEVDSTITRLAGADRAPAAMIACRCEALMMRVDEDARSDARRALRNPEAARGILSRDYVAGRLLAVRETAAELGVELAQA